MKNEKTLTEKYLDIYLNKVGRFENLKECARRQYNAGGFSDFCDALKWCLALELSIYFPQMDAHLDSDYFEDDKGNVMVVIRELNTGEGYELTEWMQRHGYNE